jgi:hypothetical protein
MNTLQKIYALGASRWFRRTMMAALLCGHALLVLREYPLPIHTTGLPVLKGDVSRYYASAYAVSGMGHSYGYDPYHMAGYAAGLWNSMGKKGFELLHLALPFVELSTLFDYTLISLSLLAPLLLWGLLCAGIRRSGHVPFAGVHHLLSLCIVLTYWHLDTQVSYFWHFGNVFYPATACLLPLVVLLTANVVNATHARVSTVLLGLVLAVIFYAHTSLLLPAAVCAAVPALMRIRQTLSARGIGRILVAGLVFSLLAAPWALALLSYRTEYNPLDYEGFHSTWKHLWMDIFSDRVYRHCYDRTALYHLCVVLGTLGLYAGGRQRSHTAVSQQGIAGLIIMALAYVSAPFPGLGSLQPYRFLLPGILLMLGPVLYGAEFVWKALTGMSTAARVASAAVLLIAVPQFTGYVADAAYVRSHGDGAAATRQILSELKRDTSTGSVLCDDIHLGHLIPAASGRRVIGGLAAEAFVRQRFTGFAYDGTLFGRHPEEWTEADLRQYMELYGVSTAILGAGKWRDFANNAPRLFSPKGESGGWQLYDVMVRQPADCDVVADYDELMVRHCSNSTVVLPFHYWSQLRADKGVTLDEVYLLSDPAPFIRCHLPAGTTEFSIRTGR